MNRVEKIALLNQLLQGETKSLQVLKQDQNCINGVVIVDEMPNEFSNKPVQARYTLNNGTEVTEQLTYAQMVAKAGNVLLILPDKYRSAMQ